MEQNSWFIDGHSATEPPQPGRSHRKGLGAASGVLCLPVGEGLTLGQWAQLEPRQDMQLLQDVPEGGPGVRTVVTTTALEVQTGPRVLGAGGCGDSENGAGLPARPPARARPRRRAAGAGPCPWLRHLQDSVSSLIPGLRFRHPAPRGQLWAAAFPHVTFTAATLYAAVCKLGRKEANYCRRGAGSTVRVPARLPALVRRAGSQATGPGAGAQVRVTAMNFLDI